MSNNAFFDAQHFITLRDKSTSITSYNDLDAHIKNEIQKIFNDSSLQKEFEKIDKAITSNQELRAFKEVIDREPDLISFLNDYEQFRKDVLLGYLHSLKEDIDNILELFNSKKTELEQLIKKLRLKIKFGKI